MRTIRRRRIVLLVPGSSAKVPVGARTLPCDGLIPGLEHSVAPEAREAERRVALLEGIAAPGGD